jgi:hypothetical protein
VLQGGPSATAAASRRRGGLTREIDRVFRACYAAAHPELVIATMMNAASSDWAAQLIAGSLQEIARRLWWPKWRRRSSTSCLRVRYARDCILKNDYSL